MKKIFILLLSAVVLQSAMAQEADSLFISKIADEVMLRGKAYDNLYHLTKKIGGRLTASPGMYKAEQWGMKVLQESGADKVWLQPCKVPHWVRGGKDEAIATIQKKKLDVIALGNSIGTGAKGITAETIEVSSFDDLEKKKDLVKGKIVFYNVKFNSRYIRTFNAYRDAVQYRGGGASRAAKYGALAVIIRSMSHSTDNNPHTGAMRYDSAYPKIPAAAIGLKDADWLSNELQRSKVNISLKTYGYFLSDTTANNVIGELTGSEFPDQYITIGGHLDSWDPAEGAHDDGAGIVQTIEVLRVLKAIGYQPRYTIRVVLFANEENGLRGGKKYADEAKSKNEKHLFALEADAGGFTPRGFGFTMSKDQFNKVSQWKSLFFPYYGDEFTEGGGGADIGPLNQALGTPVADLKPDSQRYFDYHHARNDVFENVNKRELELGALNIAALIYLIDKYGL